ncbi:hypothetical protein BC834DRAFT_899924 [Gloeopeniophorella convolvens]|nr:hypothetical protein BC834DRAFT_899924 [Gloeopeniophorella convolvens]
MDEDIQFLGMISPVSAHKPNLHLPLSSMQPPVSGIMLVIPKNGDEPTQTLRFLQSRSTVVQIGRASSSVADSEKSPDSVQFRCPVISRKHAKLLFSSGHVYIVDLHSHHGTHLLRRDEIVSRAIVPDVPIALQDGDALTFGKAVGKEPYCVSPITANVMLIYDTEAASTPPAAHQVISLIDSPSITSVTPTKGKQPATAPKSSSSGRYGIFGPRTPSSQSSPASSSDDMSQSDHDEEDEDEEGEYSDPPEEYPSTPFGGHVQAQGAGGCCAPLPSLHGLGLLASRHMMHHTSHIHAHAPHSHRALSPVHMHQMLAMHGGPSLHRWFNDYPEEPVEQDVLGGAEEPMDISRPSTPAQRVPLQDVTDEVIGQVLASVAQSSASEIESAVAAEPSIIGAYPGSPVRSAVVSPWADSEDMGEDYCHFAVSPPRQRQPQEVGSAQSSIVEVSEGAQQPIEDVASDVDADGEADDEVPDLVPAVMPSYMREPIQVEPEVSAPPAPVPVASQAAPAVPSASSSTSGSLDVRLASLDEALVNLWGNVLRMQIAHRKTQTDHKALADRTDVLATRIEAAQADVRSATATAAEVAQQDAEVGALRERVQSAEEGLTELRARVVAAEAALEEARAQNAALVLEREGRKRKRGADDDSDEEQGNNKAVSLLPPPPPTKRVRRVARAVVRTAAVATVGAVAAWSALAFA